MKINIIGKNPEKINCLKEILSKRKIEYSEENPDMVIAYGGDGTFLIAERKFPGIPKILLSDSETCQLCCNLNIEEAIDLFEEGRYEIQEIKKIKAIYEDGDEKELIGTNDIVIRNSLPTEAIRFNIKINEEFIGEFIGDGVVVSTPYGSKAYFSSITRKNFNEGIGIAFNNVTKHKEYIIINHDDKIEIEITRGPGVLVADNNRDFINLEKGNKITITGIEDSAKKIILK
jgi:NAD+ kinase